MCVAMLIVLMVAMCNCSVDDDRRDSNVGDESVASSSETTEPGKNDRPLAADAPITSEAIAANGIDNITATSNDGGGTGAESSTSPKDQLPLTDHIIGIDAGHQAKGNNEQERVAPDSRETKPKVSSDTSGVSTGTPEYELNLAVALKLQAILEERGATVIMSRDVNDVDISNKERAEMMNDADADLCIRIHANGGGSSQSGAMMLVPDGHVPSEIEKQSREAGETIFKAYLAATGATDLGVIPRSDMTGFNWSTVPVCLIEMGFMTNKTEDKLMETDEYRNKCALGLADGIEKYLAGGK
jgi:N-acetylmuramoyl-L-alanine amidase